MKKTVLFFALLFTFSTSFISCRETREEEKEVEINTEAEEAGEELEDAAEDVENTTEEGVEEIEENTTDDNL